MRWQVALAMFLASLLGTPSRARAEDKVVRGPARVNLRQGPGSSTPVIGTVASGERVEVERQSGAWVLVRTRGGQTGYIWGRYLARVSPESSQAQRSRMEEQTEVTAEGTSAGGESPAASRAVVTRLKKLCAAVQEVNQGGGGGTSRAEDELQASLARLAAGQAELRRLLSARADDNAVGARRSRRLLVATGAAGFLAGLVLGAAVRRRPPPRSRLRL